jgi:hypothetical protein
MTHPAQSPNDAMKTIIKNEVIKQKGVTKQELIKLMNLIEGSTVTIGGYEKPPE